jgi:hypothetical protein
MIARDLLSGHSAPSSFVESGRDDGESLAQRRRIGMLTSSLSKRITSSTVARTD